MVSDLTARSYLKVAGQTRKIQSLSKLQQVRSELDGFSPRIRRGKYPVQPGKIPVVLAIRHDHRQWSKRFIW